MGIERAPNRWSPYSIRYYKDRDDESEKENEKQKRKAYTEFTDEKEFDSEGNQSGMTEFDSTDHEQKSTRSGNGNQDTSGGN